jgi:hypothetical protein
MLAYAVDVTPRDRLACPGQGNQTSCFLMARPSGHPDGAIWPIAVYPAGKVEVVFQHLANRPPFDDVALREELRERLSVVPGIDLPTSKLQMRPAFGLHVLADDERRSQVMAALTWFLTTSTSHVPADGQV